jgi:hypothetical protein
MPLTSELKANYEVVLHDLEADRAAVQQEIASLGARMRELQSSILTLTRKLNPGPDPTSSQPLGSNLPAGRNYAYISVRWAILDLLYNSAGMTTAEIAEALKASGVQTRAANFVNNVSAVLTTTMLKGHQEVEQSTDGRWSLTKTGVSAIEYIRTTPKFRRACTTRLG